MQWSKFFLRHCFGNYIEFFIALFNIFFVVCYCKIEQFPVLKPAYLSFLWAVSTQLAFNECLQEIHTHKKEPIVLQSCKDFESLDFNGNGY